MFDQFHNFWGFPNHFAKIEHIICKRSRATEANCIFLIVQVFPSTTCTTKMIMINFQQWKTTWIVFAWKTMNPSIEPQNKSGNVRKNKILSLDEWIRFDWGEYKPKVSKNIWTNWNTLISAITSVRWWHRKFQNIWNEMKKKLVQIKIEIWVQAILYHWNNLQKIQL